MQFGTEQIQLCTCICQFRENTTAHTLDGQQFDATNTTTNRGLLFALCEALFYKLHGVHVVVDSKLIFQRELRRRRLKSSRLLGVYEQCLTIAAKLQIMHWAHHLHQFNAMA